MTLETRDGLLDPGQIPGRWKIQAFTLGAVNSAGVRYRVVSHSEVPLKKTAVLYLHGMGGNLNDAAFLEDSICQHKPLVRCACYGLDNHLISLLAVANLGDVCAVLHNSRQAIHGIADQLGLESYDIVAHSWGGFAATLAALDDPRCKKVMLLSSTPDILDALGNLGNMIGVAALRPLAWLGKVALLSDANNAKRGKAVHQKAWNAIDPYRVPKNPSVKMLIFNRQEDKVMKRWNVEHFLKHAREKSGMTNVSAEFITCPDLSDPHDMPLHKFKARMEQFLFA